ncbi:hypothetical protein ABT224_19905 [Streptomyces sp. NPDC001584]|uniref:hypothetical protein n=1 Tax=Streptomyces sp. NPDC001584 TaxID=3154521 RepID=UPI0033210C6D
MSTPDYDMAPPAATATVAPPAAVQPPASGAAAATDPAAQRAPRRRTASQKGESLAGVLIPGGALTGLISLCWMVHQFGLPAVIFAVLATAAAAATAVVIKVSRRAAKAASRSRTGRGTGGAGPGSGRKGGSGAGNGGGRLISGNRSGGSGPSRRSGGGPKGGTAPGALSRKPAGMGSVKSPTRSAVKNSVPRPSGKNGLGAARTGAGPKPFKGSLFGGKGGPGQGGASGGGKHRKAPQTPGTNTGRGGLFNRKNNGNGTGPGSKAPTVPKNNRKPTPLTPGGTGTGKTKTPKVPTGKGKGVGKTVPLPGGGKSGKAGKGAGTGPATSGTGKKKGGKKTRAPKHKGYTWKRNPIRKAKSVAGRGYRRVTSPKFRHRMHQVATPFKVLFRGTRKHGGKLLAHTMRWGGRLLLSSHSFLGSIRHSTMGPNWLRPLAQVLYWATSPLAKLVTVSRSWSWLNVWIYRTTGRRATPKPTSKSAPPAGSGTAAHAPTSGGHASVPSPATAASGKGTPVDNSPVHHAYPLIYAADAIRMAAAAFAVAPADSMKGYEAVIENLGHLEFAMCHLLNDIAEVTQEAFKVNPVIPDQYRALAVQFLFLGAFVDSAHQAYRTIHAEQIANIEEPTWQGRKWDISANWAHVMPAHAWTDPTVHAMPLLLAAGAIRDAGIHVKLHPSGTMFGYEMTIQHLAGLSEALYELMETVASVTEAEFRVHPGITDMHRDAGQRFRDLGVAIQGVHFLYRMVHSEQLYNLENPTPQAAKWDQARNA